MYDKARFSYDIPAFRALPPAEQSFRACYGFNSIAEVAFLVRPGVLLEQRRESISLLSSVSEMASVTTDAAERLGYGVLAPWPPALLCGMFPWHTALFKVLYELTCLMLTTPSEEGTTVVLIL